MQADQQTVDTSYTLSPAERGVWNKCKALQKQENKLKKWEQDLGRQADSLQADVDERDRAASDKLLAAEQRELAAEQREQAAAEGEQRLAASAAEAARKAAAERQAATHVLVAITLCIAGAYAAMMFDTTYLAGSGGRRILQLLARLFRH